MKNHEIILDGLHNLRVEVLFKYFCHPRKMLYKRAHMYERVNVYQNKTVTILLIIFSSTPKPPSQTTNINQTIAEVSETHFSSHLQKKEKRKRKKNQLNKILSRTKPPNSWLLAVGLCLFSTQPASHVSAVFPH